MTTRFTGEYADDQNVLHERVKAEADNRCVRCGHRNGDRRVSQDEWFAGEGDERRIKLRACTEHCSHPKDGKMRVLTVHHLDGNKSNNAWWNLLALCQVCHLQVQAKVIPEQPYLWAHSAWFLPYVCGFYAHYYGGESITRDQAIATPDSYLRLGQPWLYAAATPAPESKDQ